MDVDLANQYVVSGLEVTHFKLIRTVEDLEDEKDYFHPDMCHQVFGENETIFGYRNLRINIYFDAVTFQSYINYKYADKIQDAESGQSADDILEKLKPWLPDNFVTEKSEFIKNIQSRKRTKPFGQQLSCFQIDDREFEIYTCTAQEAGYGEFHQNMETLIVWFIDAANFIDIDDEKWRFFVVYEKDQSTYYPVGYSTVYEYYSYPSSRRYRISQFIVFPTFQNMGLGTELLRNVYAFLYRIPNIHDITVEDPSEKFQMIRDYVDCENCLTLPCFNLPKIKGDFSKEMITEARDTFKLNEKQIRRVYEILRLLNTDDNDLHEYNAYKMMVKNRLNAPFKKQEQQNSKINKLIREAPQMTPDQRIRILDKDFQALMKQYRHVLFRITRP